MDQTVIDFIKQQYDNHLEWTNRSGNTNIESKVVLLKKWEQALSGLIPVDNEMVERLKNRDNYTIAQFIENVLVSRHVYGAPDPSRCPFTIHNQVVRQLVHKSNCVEPHALCNVAKRYIVNLFVNENEMDLDTMVQFLYQQKFTDRDILIVGFDNSNALLYSHQRGNRTNDSQTPNQLTLFGQFVLSKTTSSKSFFGLVKHENQKGFIDHMILKENRNNSAQVTEWLRFNLQFLTDGLSASVLDFLSCKDYQGKHEINLPSLYLLIGNNAQRFENAILRALGDYPTTLENLFSIFVELNAKLNGKYHERIEAIGEKYLATYFSKSTSPQRYRYDLQAKTGPLSCAYAKFLIKHDPVKARTRIERYLNESDYIFPHFYEFVHTQYNGDSLPFMVDGLFKESDKADYHTTLFGIIEKHDFEPHLPRLIDFMVNAANLKNRVLTAKLIAKYPTHAMETGRRLIKEKTVNQRITGALILSELEGDDAKKALNDAVDSETNDDTRDIMLEALSEKRFAAPYPRPEVEKMIALAASRKKLANWTEKWIDEEKLPKLYWKDSSEPLTPPDIRFLLYRMKRAKGLNSDIEAKQLLSLIDKHRSGQFAKALLNAFQDSNADTKLKYYLTLAGLLGDDDMMHSLNALFKKSMADSRMKMAEYVVGALAMVGSNKALRSVENIYRKFATKKPAVSQAAKEALNASATELGISLDELADRIIPNFDFDGLYKHFQVDGDEYRAFISSDFALNFMNEDHKIRKSAPANTPKELKAEFKEIEKEVKEIVRSQSNRLEKYMIEGRRWPQADWHDFFFMNPVMFVYALKLVWGIFDEDHTLIGTFYCAEDTSLYDLDDQEVTLPDNSYVGIVHPSLLPTDLLKRWHEKAFDMKMATIFPILDREVIKPDPTELELHYTKMFHGQNVPKGADFVNTFLVKKNWIKSPSDGGSCEFTKHYRDGAIRAYANIEGPAVYYQGGDAKATVYEVRFMGKNWQDKIKISELPPIFFSEVMSDISQLIKAE